MHWHRGACFPPVSGEYVLHALRLSQLQIFSEILQWHHILKVASSHVGSFLVFPISRTAQYMLNPSSPLPPPAQRRWNLQKWPQRQEDLYLTLNGCCLFPLYPPAAPDSDPMDGVWAKKASQCPTTTVLFFMFWGQQDSGRPSCSVHDSRTHTPIILKTAACFPPSDR